MYFVFVAYLSMLSEFLLYIPTILKRGDNTQNLSFTGVARRWFGLGSFTLHFGLKYEIIYQLDAIEYLFVFFQLDMFRAYTPIFRSVCAGGVLYCNTPPAHILLRTDT